MSDCIDTLLLYITVPESQLHTHMCIHTCANCLRDVSVHWLASVAQLVAENMSKTDCVVGNSRLIAAHLSLEKS